MAHLQFNISTSLSSLLLKATFLDSFTLPMYTSMASSQIAFRLVISLCSWFMTGKTNRALAVSNCKNTNCDKGTHPIVAIVHLTAEVNVHVPQQQHHASLGMGLHVKDAVRNELQLEMLLRMKIFKWRFLPL